MSDRGPDAARQFIQFQHRIEHGVVLDLVRQCGIGPVLGFLAKIVGGSRASLLMRKNPPQPLDRARHVQFEDSRQEVIARHPELRTEIWNLHCQQADPLDHRDADSVQQYQPAPLHRLDRLDRIEQPQLIRLKPAHEPRKPVMLIELSGDARELA